MAKTRLSFGGIVYHARTGKGMTQSEVARRLGVHGDFICLIEKGHRNLSLDRVPKMAEILGIDTLELCWVALAEQYPTFWQTVSEQRRLRLSAA
jgi:transcriptional regulator with XRE-family HTH domain